MLLQFKFPFSIHVYHMYMSRASLAVISLFSQSSLRKQIVVIVFVFLFLFHTRLFLYCVFYFIRFDITFGKQTTKKLFSERNGYIDWSIDELRCCWLIVTSASNMFFLVIFYYYLYNCMCNTFWIYLLSFHFSITYSLEWKFLFFCFYLYFHLQDILFASRQIVFRFVFLLSIK